MTAALERELAHRPWPLPERPWILFQSWQELLFLHWRVPSERLRALVPAPLELDEHEGEAWVGVVPFVVRAQRFRALPPLPGLREFPELNVRTYVRHAGRGGVFFFSLDAGSRLAVLGARAGFHLPYFLARMSARRTGERVEYQSERLRGAARFAATYRPTGPPAPAPRGSLAEFLVERYALFVVRAGRVLRGDIHHAPWPLQPAEVEIAHESIAAAAGIDLPGTAPLAHFVARQDTHIWCPELTGFPALGGPAGAA